MKFTKRQIVKDTYEIQFQDFDINTLSGAEHMDKIELHSILSVLFAEMNLSIYDVSVWNTTHNEDENIIPFCWHDDQSDEVDTLFLIYFTDEILTQETGGRLGLKDSNNEVFTDIYSGLCIIQHQKKGEILHKVEQFRKTVNKRLVISCCLSGWKSFDISQ